MTDKIREEARQAWQDQCSQDNEGGVDSVGFIYGYEAGRKRGEVEVEKLNGMYKKAFIRDQLHQDEITQLKKQLEDKENNARVARQELAERDLEYKNLQEVGRTLQELKRSNGRELTHLRQRLEEYKCANEIRVAEVWSKIDLEAQITHLRQLLSEAVPMIEHYQSFVSDQKIAAKEVKQWLEATKDIGQDGLK